MNLNDSFCPDEADSSKELVTTFDLQLRLGRSLSFWKGYEKKIKQPSRVETLNLPLT